MIPQRFFDMNKVCAYIKRDGYGRYHVFCQRAKRKWWFELGKHAATDAAFERAYLENSVHWVDENVDDAKFFQKM